MPKGSQFEYSTWYGDLSQELASKVCTCLEKGWSFDPESKHWVCGRCRKPSRYCSIFTCESCGSQYYESNAENAIYEAECPNCSGESKWSKQSQSQNQPLSVTLR